MWAFILEEGLFYGDDLDDAQIKVLQAYVSNRAASTADGYSRKLKLYSRSEFLEKVMYAAIQTGSAIVAFNLPFDLSRLAVEYRVARNAGGRGCSFVLFRYYDRKKRKWLPNSFRPRIKLRPKDSKAAFIRLAGGDMNQPYRLGRFIDLKTLVWALRNKSLKLDTACQVFGVPGKMDHTPTGRVTSTELTYCREDVRATVDLLNALRAEFDGYPIGLLPEKAYSAASIAKACLQTMGLSSPLEKFQLDDRLLGICMQAYYGGRAECRIRHTPVPVVRFHEPVPHSQHAPEIMACADCQKVASPRGDSRSESTSLVVNRERSARSEKLACTGFLCPRSTRR